MHLRDRSGRDGWTELGEQLVDRPAERRFDDAARLGIRERRQPVLEGFETAGDIGPENVGPRGQELAHLDRGGTELLERLREPLTGGKLGVLALARTEEPCRNAHRDRHTRGIFPRQKRVIRRQRAGHAHQNEDVLQCTEHHAFQPECMAAMPPDRFRCFTWVKPAFSIFFANCGLRREAPDAFGEIAIRRSVTGHQFAKPRQHREGIEIVEIIEPGCRDAREFETKEPPAGLEHAIGFGERLVEMRGVADAERDRIGVLA